MLPTAVIPLDGSIISRNAGRSRLSGRGRVTNGIYTLDLHPDTRSLRDRIFARGGVVKDADIEIVDRLFVRRMIANGLKQYATFCLLPIGENLAAARTLLWYPPNIADALIGVNATEGTYDKARGLTCSSTSIYFRTGYIPSVQGHTNGQGSLSVYGPRNQGSSGVDVGAHNGTTQSFFVGINTGGSYTANLYSGSTGRIQVTNSVSTLAYVRADRVSTTDLRYHSNANQIGSTVTTTSDGTIPTVEAFIGARNNLGTADNASSRSISLVTMSPLGLPVSLQGLMFAIARDTLRALGRVA